MNYPLANTFLTGAIMMAFFIAGLFFLRFWKKTGDIFFRTFAVAFWIMAFERTLLAVLRQTEMAPFVYTLRLTAFTLIIWAVWQKNSSNDR